MNKELLTAAKARHLAGVPDEEYVSQAVARLLVSVENEAKNKKRLLATGYTHKEDYELWINNGYSQTNDWKLAKEMLEKLGYKVKFFYEELQFVDMYTLVEW